MAVEDAADRAVFFDADDFAVAAQYTPPGGDPVPVTVIKHKPDAESPLGLAGWMLTAAEQAAALLVELRRDQVAAPARAAAFALDAPAPGEAAGYTVRSARLSRDGEIWLLALEAS